MEYIHQIEDESSCHATIPNSQGFPVILHRDLWKTDAMQGKINELIELDEN
jgi:hypothetical protein